MIAIASGLLGNLETATSTVVKKDEGSGGFAAAFEEVSAKDAGAVAQAGVSARGKRGVGGGGNHGGQAGIVGGRSSRSAVLTKKAAGTFAGEGTAAEGKGAVGAAVVSKAASSVGAGAGKPVFAAKLNAADFVEAESADQEGLAGSEAHGVGPSAGDKGVSSSVSKGPDSAGSTVAGALPGGATKVSAQGLAGNGAPGAPGAGTVLKVGVATPEIQIGGRVDAGAVQTQSADVASAVEGALPKPFAGAVPDVIATGDSTAGKDGSHGVGARSAEGVGVDRTAATKETRPAGSVAAGASGQTARVSKESGAAAFTKAQGVSGVVQTSTAKPVLQQAGGTVQIQATEAPVTPVVVLAAQDVAGAAAQASANGTPVVGAKQGLAQEVEVASAGADGATRQGLGSGNAPVFARSTVGPWEIIPQQANAPSVVAGPATVQPAITPQSNVQTTGNQPAGAESQDAAGLVAQDASNVAHLFGGPATKTEQVTPQQAIPVGGGSQQTGTQPAKPKQPVTQAQTTSVGTQQIATQQVGMQKVGTEQVSKSEENAIAPQTDLSGNRAAKAVQQAGNAVDAGARAEKNNHAPSVAASGSSTAKKVAASGSDRSADANAEVASTVANASVMAAALSLPPLSSSPQSGVTTVQGTPVASIAARTNHAADGADGAKANIVAVPDRGASASPMMAGTVADPVNAPGAAPGFDAALESTGAAGQAVLPGGSAITDVVGQGQDSLAPVAAAAITEVAALQAGRVAVGGAPAARERRLPTAEGKTAERTSAETAPTAQPIASQHLAGPGLDAAKSSSGSHPSSSESGIPSLATGTAGAGGAVPLSANQVATHTAVATNVTATATAGGTAQSSTLTGGTGGLASTGIAGPDSLVSPMAHTTLQATPTVLEVGVPGGTHGWLKIRAEIGEGGTVQASMSAASHEGQETLRRELPAMNAFLDSEHVPVSVQVAAHGVSGAGSSSVAGGDTGFNLGSGLSQDAGSTQREAQAGLLGGGDGARQGSGDGSQESTRTTGGAASARVAASAESDWVRSSNADPGSGYGSGISGSGGSWLNVMA